MSNECEEPCADRLKGGKTVLQQDVSEGCRSVSAEQCDQFGGHASGAAVLAAQ